jgi:hypothetical protein
VPPQALVRFSVEPIFTQMILPGPAGVADLSFQVQGQLDDSGQGSPAAGPGATWSLKGTYTLEVHVHEKWSPPGPAEASGPAANAGGSLTATYTIDGQIDSVLTVSQAGDQAQTIIHRDHEHLTETGSVTGTIYAPVPFKGQEIDFVSQAASTAQDSGTVVRKLPGRTKFGSITLERGVIHDQSFESWRQTLRSQGPWGSTAVRAIDAAFATTDRLDEALLLASRGQPAQPISIAAFFTAAGTLGDNVFPPEPLMPAEAPFLLLRGTSRWQGQLTETIAHPSVPRTPPEQITETTQAQGRFASASELEG